MSDVEYRLWGFMYVPYICKQAHMMLRSNLNTITRSQLPNPAKQGRIAHCLHNCLKISEPETSAQPAIRGADSKPKG